MKYQAQRRRLWELAFILALLLALAPGPSSTQAASHTYVRETGHYLGGGFRDFWQRNGGLYVFGYPITEEFVGPNGRVMQYFERARMELFPEHAGSAHAVQLGLLGIEVTQGRVFPQIPPRPNDANHRYFPETKHMIMWGFKTIWETRGGLALFGYPISEEIMEVLPADNQWHVVQYFERARFEYWPNLPDGQRVLISDLGRRLAPAELTAPLPPGAPPGTPVPAPAPPAPPAPAPPAAAPAPAAPPNVDASVTPPAGPPGTEFVFNAWGFQPGETVSLWATAPDQSVLPADFQVPADPDGSLASAEITFFSDMETLPGVWAITAHGTASGKSAIGYFVVLGGSPAGAPPGTLPENHNASTQPREGPQGTTFLFFAHGFVGGENVLIGVFNSQDELISDVLIVPADANGSLDAAQVRFATSRDTPPDVYEIYATGENSGREAYAFVRVTPATTTLDMLGFKGRSVKRGLPAPGLYHSREQ